jgi:hypothetical protein
LKTIVLSINFEYFIFGVNGAGMVPGKIFQPAPEPVPIPDKIFFPAPVPVPLVPVPVPVPLVPVPVPVPVRY